MQTLGYGNPGTVLRGQIYTDYFYGRSGYGETPEIDELEHAIFLALDTPISIPARDPRYEGDFESIGCTDVRTVQLAGAVDVQHLRDIRGHGVELTGSLFHSHTGHHHAEVLISIEDKLTTILDDRNTYVGGHVARSGTGFLLGRNGLIGTAAHVVAGALGITITRGLYRLKAALDYTDSEADLAVLKVEPAGIMANVIAHREERVRPIRTWMPPQLGERVYAFGFPLRPVLPHTLNMSEGIVSAETGLRGDRFQISAPIQKGNSGGPVYDQHANLIGIVTSKLLPKDGLTPENVNFVIRTQRLLDTCRDLKVDVDTRESRIQNPPVVLAKLMQELCVEVECWEADAK
jgi:S1-C subfamily serine protease